MSEDDRDEDAKLARALFRYRLIAEAVEAPRGARKAILREVAEQDHVWPDGKTVRVTVRTLERWVARYRRERLAGLMRASRKDKGRLRGIADAAIVRAIELRKEEPTRSTSTLIDILERAELVARGCIRRSTLDRHLDRRDASRRMLHVLGIKRHVRLHFEHPLDFVVGDFHAGPYIRTGPDEIRRSELGAFIDHCSRYVPESRYGLTEDLMHVRRGLRMLCVGHGLPHKIYVDYVARHIIDVLWPVPLCGGRSRRARFLRWIRRSVPRRGYIAGDLQRPGWLAGCSVPHARDRGGRPCWSTTSCNRAPSTGSTGPG